MKILIFGGAGFLGTNIGLEARKRGYEVIAFDSLIRKHSEENIPIIEKAGITLIRGDVRNPEDFERIPNDIEGIINCAANPGIPWSIAWPKYDFNVNAMGALNILEYSRNHGKIPVIFASTNKIYSEEINDIFMEEKETRYEWVGKAARGISEDFPMDSRGKYPHSPYGSSKASADLYHQEYYHVFGVPTVINRMSCLYGIYQKGVEDQGFADFFVRQICFGDGKLNIYGDGKQVRDMLFGADVARLYLDELENIDKVKGQVFNIGGGEENKMSLLEIIKTLEDISGKKASLSFHGWRTADQKVFYNDLSKVKRILGWGPTISPTDGLQMMHDNYLHMSEI